jgi:hypothetical protein
MQTGLKGLVATSVLSVVALAGATPAAAQSVPIRREPVVYTNVFGVVTYGNSLRKVAEKGWNAGASSNKLIAFGDGAVRFVARENDTYRIAGLGHVDKNQGLEDVEFGWFLAGDGWAYPVEHGIVTVWPGRPVAYKPGTVFEVAIRNGRVEYHATGAPTTYAIGRPMYPIGFDTSLYDTGATIADAWITGFLVDAPRCGEVCIE